MIIDVDFQSQDSILMNRAWRLWLAVIYWFRGSTIDSVIENPQNRSTIFYPYFTLYVMTILFYLYGRGCYIWGTLFGSCPRHPRCRASRIRGFCRRRWFKRCFEVLRSGVSDHGVGFINLWIKGKHEALDIPPADWWFFFGIWWNIWWNMMDKIVWNRQTMIFWFKIVGKNDAIQWLEVVIT